MRFTAIAAAALVAAAPFAVHAESSASLLQAIRHARVIDLSHTWEINSPIAFVNPSYTFALKDTHAGTIGNFGDPELSYASEVMNWSGQHGAPSIDAIGHIGRGNKLFGGANASESTINPDGIGAGPDGVGAHLAIDQFPTDLLINRGVLLDVARVLNGDASPLAAGYEITGADLKKTAEAHKVKLQKGDTVFIRTGWGPKFVSAKAQYVGDFSPGPGLNAAEYLIAQGASIVGNDTLTFEKRPPVAFTPKLEIFPVHKRLIADKGIYIIENLNLEELAEAKVYEFPVVVPPLKVKGGTGSAVRVFALVPR